MCGPCRKRVGPAAAADGPADPGHRPPPSLQQSVPSTETKKEGRECGETSNTNQCFRVAFFFLEILV